MQGINKAKHAHLIDALHHLQQIIQQADTPCAQQAAAYSVALKDKYSEYEILLRELAIQIEAYEDLFAEVKVQFLGRKLRELKRQTLLPQPTFSVLRNAMHLEHST